MDGGPTMVDRSEMACRLGAARADGILDGLDLMACGGVLIDRLGNVLRVNRSAQHQLGCGVLVAHRRLVALDKPANLLLQGLLERALCEATTQGVQGPVALPRPERLPLIATVAPLPASPGAAAPPRRPEVPDRGGAAPPRRPEVPDRGGAAPPWGAVVALVDPDWREPVGTVLERLFRLTPAEMRLCRALAKGDDLTAFASAHDLSIGTVRSQLKAVLDKTGTHRQGELVALLARMSVPVPRQRGAR